MSIYMKIPNVQGDVSTAGHQGEIELLNLQLQLRRPMMNKAGVGTRETGAPKISEMVIYKHADSSSIELLQALLNATVIPELTISLTNTSAHTSYTLKNVMISRISEQADDSSQHPIEVLHLNFTEFEKSTTSKDKLNKAKAPQRLGYSLTEAKVL